MELIKINSNNRPYYSDDFIKGFECGAQRQLEADKADIPTWIPCSERLPEWNTRVLFYLEKECYYDYPEPQYVTDWWIQEGCFNDKYGAFVYDSPDIGKGISKDCVAAWMPLPKPYGERKESE